MKNIDDDTVFVGPVMGRTSEDAYLSFKEYY